MRLIIKENYENMCRFAADFVADAIRAHKGARPFVLGLPTGSTPLGVYRELTDKVKRGELSFANVVTFNMDEYLGLSRDDPQSYWRFMWDNFFDRIDIPKENVHILDGTAQNPERECADYEAQITAAGGVDLFLGGIGVDGHIAFNEPNTPLDSRTGVRILTAQTVKSNARFFGGDESKVPKAALSVGVGTVTDARAVMLLVSGENKATALRETVEGEVCAEWTASALQTHKNALIVTDADGAAKLSPETVARFTAAENARRLFFAQKQTLDTFLRNGAITEAQYEKSLTALAEKMQIRDFC